MADGTKNPTIAKKKQAIAKRRRQVAELLGRHTTQATMAQMLKVSVGTISSDVRAVLKQWQKESTEVIERLRGRELAELSQIEADAAQQFARFRQPRWLDIRLKCKERRAKMMGLDMPLKMAQTDARGDDLPLTVREIVVRVPAGPPPVDEEGRPLVRVIGGPPPEDLDEPG